VFAKRFIGLELIDDLTELECKNAGGAMDGGAPWRQDGAYGSETRVFAWK